MFLRLCMKSGLCIRYQNVQSVKLAVSQPRFLAPTEIKRSIILFYCMLVKPAIVFQNKVTPGWYIYMTLHFNLSFLLWRHAQNVWGKKRFKCVITHMRGNILSTTAQCQVCLSGSKADRAELLIQEWLPEPRPPTLPSSLTPCQENLICTCSLRSHQATYAACKCGSVFQRLEATNVRWSDCSEGVMTSFCMHPWSPRILHTSDIEG